MASMIPASSPEFFQYNVLGQVPASLGEAAFPQALYPLYGEASGVLQFIARLQVQDQAAVSLQPVLREPLQAPVPSPAPYVAPEFEVTTSGQMRPLRRTLREFIRRLTRIRAETVEPQPEPEPEPQPELVEPPAPKPVEPPVQEPVAPRKVPFNAYMSNVATSLPVVAPPSIGEEFPEPEEALRMARSAEAPTFTVIPDTMPVVPHTKSTAPSIRLSQVNVMAAEAAEMLTSMVQASTAPEIIGEAVELQRGVAEAAALEAVPVQLARSHRVAYRVGLELGYIKETLRVSMSGAPEPEGDRSGYPVIPALRRAYAVEPLRDEAAGARRVAEQIGEAAQAIGEKIADAVKEAAPEVEPPAPAILPSLGAAPSEPPPLQAPRSSRLPAEVIEDTLGKIGEAAVSLIPEEAEPLIPPAPPAPQAPSPTGVLSEMIYDSLSMLGKAAESLEPEAEPIIPPEVLNLSLVASSMASALYQGQVTVHEAARSLTSPLFGLVQAAVAPSVSTAPFVVQPMGAAVYGTLTEAAVRMQSVLSSSMMEISPMVPILPAMGDMQVGSVPSLPSARLVDIARSRSVQAPPTVATATRVEARPRPSFARSKPIEVRLESTSDDLDLRDLERKLERILKEEARRHGVY